MPSLLTTLRDRLAELYGPRLAHVVLFGSQARGDARSDSDIDILVVLHGAVRPVPEIERTSGIVAELSLAGDCVLALTFTDAASYASRRSPLLDNIRREGIAL